MSLSWLPESWLTYERIRDNACHHYKDNAIRASHKPYKPGIGEHVPVSHNKKMIVMSVMKHSNAQTLHFFALMGVAVGCPHSVQPDYYSM